MSLASFKFGSVSASSLQYKVLVFLGSFARFFPYPNVECGRRVPSFRHSWAVLLLSCLKAVCSSSIHIHVAIPCAAAFAHWSPGHGGSQCHAHFAAIFILHIWTVVELFFAELQHGLDVLTLVPHYAALFPAVPASMALSKLLTPFLQETVLDLPISC